MSALHRAIVLRNYSPKTSKLSLLDDQYGKIEVISRHAENACVGAFIEYNFDQRTGNRNSFLLPAFHLYEMPMQVARDDIYFLHHVIELCYFFIPLGSEAKNIFDLLEILYISDLALLNKKRKKIFLSKLFTLFGMTPDYKDVKKRFVYQLFSMVPGELPLIELPDEDEKTIEEWLLRCIASHPEARKMKTKYF